MAAGFRRFAFWLALGLMSCMPLVSASPQEAVTPDVISRADDNASSARLKVALVLSGGSALGIAHVGVIRELETAGIPIDMVLGTSMGALVGGLYAAGYSPDEMEELVNGFDWISIFSEGRDALGGQYLHGKHVRFPVRMDFDQSGIQVGRGLISGQNILTLLTALTLHMLADRDFNSFPVPYRAVAADILTGEKIVLSEGSLAEAMRSSMSIPGLFRPYEVKGRSLVDGGIVDNMPVEMARAMGADIVIAVESRTGLAESDGQLKTGFDITAQTMGLYVEENMRRSRAAADLVIKPDLSGYSSMSYAASRALVEKGAAGARTMSAQIGMLAARIAKGRGLVTPDTEPNRRAMHEPPVLAGVRVDAASASDEAAARSAFQPLVGKRLDQQSLTAAIDAIYASGDYLFVKFDLEKTSDPAGVIGIVKIERNYRPNTGILLGAAYHGVVSGTYESEASLLSGFELANLSGQGSSLTFQADLWKGVLLRAEYYQPLDFLFLNPFVEIHGSSDYSRTAQYIVQRADFFDAGGGAWLGANLGDRVAMMLGWSLEAVGGAATLGTPGNVGTVSFAVLGDTRHASVFPERGIAFLVRARLADPSFGGDMNFAAAELRWNAALRLSRIMSLGVAGQIGTDFSGFVDGATVLPPVRRFDLHAPGMFYGLGRLSERDSGDHVAGLGLELRRRIGRVSALFGGDIIALANLSAGVARVTGDPFRDFFPLRWNACLGLGLRLSPSFGFLLTGGAVIDSDAAGGVRPALSFEIGSMSDFLEDLR